MIAIDTTGCKRLRVAATLVLDPFEPLAKTDVQALTEAGEHLVRFVEPDAIAYGVQVEGKLILCPSAPCCAKDGDCRGLATPNPYLRNIADAALCTDVSVIT